MKQQFYITYRNRGKPEKTPILGDTKEWADRQVDLLKAQDATAIRVHWEEAPSGTNACNLWSCPQCDTVNDIKWTHCRICGRMRPDNI